ncbi:transmembrane protein 273 isoform X1 [Phaenicophaeus curvirostris]|uniref:transmembrane protein 273 isoform X1 n=1 Tax=Phaenicophaeus curvirostris TaxID=33595 RepID=UPI0037F09F21
MTLLTSWISVLMAFLLLLHFRTAKVYASGNSEEEIDFTYVILGVTLGAFLAIGFVALIICMIKNQMIDNVFEGQTWDQAKTEMSMYKENKVQMINNTFAINSYLL